MKLMFWLHNCIYTQVHTHSHTCTCTHTRYPSVAPRDYGDLTNFRLGPFNNSVRQLSFNVSIVDDHISEDEETFSASLTLDPADQTRLGSCGTVSPDVATFTIIEDNDRKQYMAFMPY